MNDGFLLAEPKTSPQSSQDVFIKFGNLKKPFKSVLWYFSKNCLKRCNFNAYKFNLVQKTSNGHIQEKHKEFLFSKKKIF